MTPSRKVRGFFNFPGFAKFSKIFSRIFYCTMSYHIWINMRSNFFVTNLSVSAEREFIHVLFYPPEFTSQSTGYANLQIANFSIGFWLTHRYHTYLCRHHYRREHVIARHDAFLADTLICPTCGFMFKNEKCRVSKIFLFFLKVPKCENFHRTDFFYFYTIKPLWVGDFRVKIQNSKF